MHLINIGGGRQVIALESATALILNRYMEFDQTQQNTITIQN